MGLFIHQHAEEDLFRIAETAPKSVAVILAVLEQMKADPDLIDKVTTRGDNQFGHFRLGMSDWKTGQRQANLWRFRVFDTPATLCRVIYAYDYLTRRVCVLAVVQKIPNSDRFIEDFDYDDPSSGIARRVIADLHSLD